MKDGSDKSGETAARVKATDREERQAIAARLVQAREAWNLSQADAYRALKVSQQRLSYWESATTLPNSPRYYRAICDLYGISLDWLILGNAGRLDPAIHLRLYGRSNN